MRRQGQYADPAANPMMAAAQMQMSGQMSQHVSEMNRYPGQRESLHSEDEYRYKQWERNAPRGSNSVTPQGYREGSGGDISQSMFQTRSDSKLASERQSIDAKTREQSEGGYDDSLLPQTFEGLEQKFFEDITKLIKEQHDAEDAEMTRHREKLAEINAQYQEKLLTIRARQTAHREEFLRKESQVRFDRYREANMSNYNQTAVPGGPHSYVPMGADPSAYGDMHQVYGRDPYESYRDRSQLAGTDRGRAMEPRGPYPGGRAYNSGGRQF